MSLRQCVFWLAFALSVFPKSQAAEPDAANELKIEFQVEKFELPNGLTVLLHRDPSVPIISYHTWFRVGSKDEIPGKTGMAHLFEHMMFKGAKRYNNKQFDQILQSNGGSNNAFTSRDATAYYINLPSSKLELAIDMESDRLESLQVSAENLSSERDVVKEERRYRVENEITGLMDEVMYSLVFKVHPYRWPIIGWMRDLTGITVQDCVEFFKKFYAPNNAVISIAGDFDLDDAKKMITKFYGVIPRGPERGPRKKDVEPVQTGERRQTLKKDVQSEYFLVNYPAPTGGSEDGYALDLLASILSEGISSRLQKKLVYQKPLVSQVRASNQGMLDAGIFEVSGVMQPGQAAAPVVEIIHGEIFELSKKVVADKELERARMQTLKSYVDSLKTVYGKAQSLAMNEVLLGDYKRLFEDIGKYQRITPEMVRAVAEKYLNRNRRNVVIATPQNRSSL
ncbi:MAG: insulinase family protein [Bdellovibrionales bacterium]|nr:insulinase family protein [Bdellovibrionales bacterium]